MRPERLYDFCTETDNITIRFRENKSDKLQVWAEPTVFHLF